MRELSDISFILIDSTKPLPESLCNFIKDNLEKILPQCAFVLTKFDLIPEKERDMMVAYTRMKVENTFGIKDALILPFSSLAILEESDSDMYKLSVESEEKLLSFMKKKKAVAQLKKTIYFADLLYDTAEQSINAASEETEKQLELLKKTKQTDLSDFIKEQKQLRSKNYADEALVVEVEVQKEIQKLEIEARKNVISKIKSRSSLDDLKAYVNNTFSSDCQSEMQKIADYSNNKLYEASQSAGLQILIFQEEFQNKFKELSILDVDFKKYEEKRTSNMAKSTNKMLDTKKYVSDELTKENTAFFGGAAAGALVGTTIAPGVGTVIGAVVGFFAGGFFRPDLEKVKNKTIEKLAPGLNSYVSDTCGSVLTNFRKQIAQLSEGIKSEIDAYYAQYNETVDMEFLEETNKMNSIKHKLNSIKSDMQEIRNRRFVLSSVEKQADMLGRKENSLEQ